MLRFGFPSKLATLTQYHILADQDDLPRFPGDWRPFQEIEGGGKRRILEDRYFVVSRNSIIASFRLQDVNHRTFKYQFNPDAFAFIFKASQQYIMPVQESRFSLSSFAPWI